MFGLSTLTTTLIALALGALLLVGGLGITYNSGRDAATRELQPKIDILTSVVAADEITIKQMTADAAQNDKLLAQYTDAIDQLTKKTVADLIAIHELEKNDKTVGAYLSTRVPDTLRSLLNNEFQDPPGVQGGARVTTKGAGATLSGSFPR